jgi:outer membrane protein assembly factor BamB
MLAIGSQLSRSVKAQSSEPTWPMFQFDSANTGYNPDASIAAEQVGQQWRSSTLGEVVASPVIADEAAFVGSRDGRVRAMNLEDGSKQWEYNVGEPIESTPAISNGSIFVGSIEGNVYCLSLSGGENWKFETAPSESEEYTILSDLSTDGNYVYLLAGKEEGSWREGKIYCLTPDGGREVWNYPLIDWAWPHTPAIHSGTLYTFGLGEEDNANGSIIALNTTDGTVEWSGGDTNGHGGITTDGTSVYVTLSSKTYALDASDGSLQWEYDYSELENPSISSSASVDGRDIYITVNTNNNNSYLYELDAVTGKKTSQIRILDETRSSPIVSEDSVYVCSEGGVYGIDKASFEETWSFTTDGVSRSTPALVGGSLYVGDNSGFVYSLGKIDEDDEEQASTEESDQTEEQASTEESTETAETETTTQESSNTSTSGATPTETENDFERGFFANGSGSSFEFLNNPFVLTVGGFFLSILGIVYQLIKGD